MGATEWTLGRGRPTIALVPTADEDASEATREPAAATASAAAVNPIEEAAAHEREDDEENRAPLALIVRVRGPDRPATRTIGAPTPEHAGPGVVVTFGITSFGRGAERTSIAGRVYAKERDNVLSVPHPRLSSAPTRVATTTSLDDERDS